nr:FaeA/PapI family transcriptional regulator [Spirochaetota bacterium]
SSSSRKNNGAYKKDIESLIIQTIKRRPCTLEDLSQILGLRVNEINKYLGVLEKDKKIQTVNQDRGIFYTFISNSNS